MKSVMQNLVFVSLIGSIPAFAANHKCEVCAEADALATDWSAAKSPEKVDELSKQSNRLLKKLTAMNKRSINPNVVHAMVNVLATIYIHDDDPLDDELDTLRPAFKKKPFKELFDQEVAKLPSDAKEKVMFGISWLQASKSDDELDFE